jgi:hypothetical protein
MTVFPGWEPPVGPDDTAPEPPQEIGLFARIEGLVGEERALLRVPERDRDDHQRDRLESIGDELDRVYATLRRRAERLAH